VIATAGFVLAAAMLIRLMPSGSPIDRPADACASPPALRTFRGVTLQPSALRAFKLEEGLAGRPIVVV
jgi:hypothetical protein